MKTSTRLLLSLAALSSLSVVTAVAVEVNYHRDPEAITSVDASSSAWNALDYSSYGVEFRNQLSELIYDTGHRTIGYSSNNEVLKHSDASPTHPDEVVPFYHSEEDHTNSWNKEHTWPNSRGAGKSGPGADPHMLRPTYSSENSSRGNDFYGPEGNRQWDPASLGFEGARGEAARIIFYVSTRYHSRGLVLSNNPNDNWDVIKSMGTLRYLVEWNNKYPVTNSERRRNDYLEEEGFGRNPFIDNPDLANYIYDVNGLRTTPYHGGDHNPDGVYLTLSPSSLSLPVGERGELSVSVYGASEDSLNVYSYDTSVATVTSISDTEFRVEAVGVGETSIFVSSTEDPSASVSCSVEVYDPDEVVTGDRQIELTASSLNLGQYNDSDQTVEVGGVAFGYNTVGNFDGGRTIQMKKSQGKIWNEANNGNIQSIVVSYTKGAESVACYFGDSLKPNNGKANPTSSGEVYTYRPSGPATYFQLVNGNASVANIQSIQINFAEAPVKPEVESVTLSPSSLNLEIGEKDNIIATIMPSDADKTLTWSSSDTRVATVEGNGLVTAVSAGTATITATALNGVKDTVEVKVEAPIAPTELRLSPSSLELEVEGTAQLKTSLLPAEANQAVTYSSSDESVAKVSSEGKVTAVSSGTAIITATSVADPAVLATCTVTVKAKEQPECSISMPNTAIELNVNESVYFEVAATGGELKVESNHPEIAAFQDNRIYGYQAGQAEITAFIVGTEVSKTCLVTVKDPNEDNEPDEPNPPIEKAKDVEAFGLTFHGTGISQSGDSLAFAPGAEATVQLESTHERIFLNSTGDLNLKAGSEANNLTAIDHSLEGDDTYIYAIPDCLNLSFSNTGDTEILLNGLELLDDPAGCQGSVVGSVGAASIALVGLSAVFFIRKRKHD